MNISRPPVSWRLANIVGRTSGSRPLATRWFCQPMNTQTMNVPSSRNQMVSDSEANDLAPAFGMIHPHSLDRSTP